MIAKILNWLENYPHIVTALIRQLGYTPWGRCATYACVRTADYI